MKRLQRLAAAGHLAPIDVELGALLARKSSAVLGDVGDVGVVALTGALLSAERARGNSCLDLAQVAGGAPWPHADAVFPAAREWRALLERSGLCNDGSSPAPLVLEGDRLYLRRFHAAERRLAHAVRARVGVTREAQIDDACVALFRRLFPAGDSTDWQAVAAAAALRGRLTVITGGPGTGKTTTVARILALLLQRDPSLRIALAAPTGKAAARLSEAIVAGLETLPIDDAARARAPRAGRTLHRLLGYQPWNDRFGHDADRPLAEDVVVVDEASMVDLLTMDALFAALRPTARIILLGDPDQLASVDTGHVLGDLCAAAAGCGDDHGNDLCAWFARLSGMTLTASAKATALRDCVVRLHRSYRFERQPGIGALATAVREGDASTALAALAEGRYADVRRRDAAGTSAMLDPLRDLLDRYLDAATPAAALEALASFRVLCAHREGRAGVAGLNEAVERALGRRATRSAWYDRRPVLVTANDPSTGLFNGDVGVTFTVEGRLLVWFADGAGGVRGVSPARLPAHDTAWAMTVHKSQGSEADRVLLVLPDEPGPLLTRELLYTAVTRARKSVDIVGSESVLASAISRAARRASGLAGRLSG